MRTLFLVGRIKNPKVIEFARQCAWCRAWGSRADYIAAHRDHAKVSHTICGACSEKFNAEIDSMGPSAA